MYGVIFCKKCEDEDQEELNFPYEFTAQSIRESRTEYAKDIYQPVNTDGTLSKEFLDEYGEDRFNATKDQIKNAKYTNKGKKGWWDRHRSKGGRK